MPVHGCFYVSSIDAMLVLMHFSSIDAMLVLMHFSSIDAMLVLMHFSSIDATLVLMTHINFCAQGSPFSMGLVNFSC